MKIYTIIITIVAVCALGLAGYFYWQGGDMRKDFGVCQDQREGFMKDKAQLESQLNMLDSQLGKVNHSVAALKTVLNSFMFAGDVRAVTIGSKETTAVEQALANIDDDKDRMMAETDWADFKSSRYLNPLLGLLRNLTYSIERSAGPPPAAE